MQFLAFVQQLAEQKKRDEHEKTAANYVSALRAFRRFLCTSRQGSLTLEQVTEDVIRCFEHHLLRECGVRRNTSSVYIRSLRAAYNEALRLNLCPDRHPFTGVYTGVDRTCKRAIGESDLQRLFFSDLGANQHLAFSRDLFYFSFLGHGIPFIDMAKLCTDDVQGGHLVYARSKTGQRLMTEICPAMNQIIRRWHVTGSKRLFPIVGFPFCQSDYEVALRRYNRHLQLLAVQFGIQGGLNSYAARHSWASEAYRLGVAVDTISSCMGHTTEATTRIYLRSLSTQQTDMQLRPVLDAYQRPFA